MNLPDICVELIGTYLDFQTNMKVFSFLCRRNRELIHNRRYLTKHFEIEYLQMRSMLAERARARMSTNLQAMKWDKDSIPISKNVYAHSKPHKTLKKQGFIFIGPSLVRLVFKLGSVKELRYGNDISGIFGYLNSHYEAYRGGKRCQLLCKSGALAFASGKDVERVLKEAIHRGKSELHVEMVQTLDTQHLMKTYPARKKCIMRDTMGFRVAIINDVVIAITKNGDELTENDKMEALSLGLAVPM